MRRLDDIQSQVKIIGQNTMHNNINIKQEGKSPENLENGQGTFQRLQIGTNFCKACSTIMSENSIIIASSQYEDEEINAEGTTPRDMILINKNVDLQLTEIDEKFQQIKLSEPLKMNWHMKDTVDDQI